MPPPTGSIAPLCKRQAIPLSFHSQQLPARLSTRFHVSGVGLVRFAAILRRAVERRRYWPGLRLLAVAAGKDRIPFVGVSSESRRCHLVAIHPKAGADVFDYPLFGDNLTDVSKEQGAHNVASARWLSRMFFCHGPFLYTKLCSKTAKDDLGECRVEDNSNREYSTRDRSTNGRRTVLCQAAVLESLKGHRKAAGTDHDESGRRLTSPELMGTYPPRSACLCWLISVKQEEPSKSETALGRLAADAASLLRGSARRRAARRIIRCNRRPTKRRGQRFPAPSNGANRTQTNLNSPLSFDDHK